MARKPRDTKAEYARRIARAEAAAGRPLLRGERGRARGKIVPPGRTEASIRMERERREAEAIGALTKTEYRQVAKWIDELDRRVAEQGDRTFPGVDAGLRAEIIGWATEVGYEHMKAEMAYLRRNEQQGMSWAEIEARVDSGEGIPDARLYRYRRAEMMAGRQWTPRSQARKNARVSRARRERRMRKAAARKRA